MSAVIRITGMLTGHFVAGGSGAYKTSPHGAPTHVVWEEQPAVKIHWVLMGASPSNVIACGVYFVKTPVELLSFLC